MACAVHPGPSDSPGDGHPSLTPGPVCFDDQTSHEAEGGQGTHKEKSPILRASFARWGHPSRPVVARHEQREAILILTCANRHGKPPNDGEPPRRPAPELLAPVTTSRPLPLGKPRRPSLMRRDTLGSR